MFATGRRAVGFTIVWPEGVIFSSMMTYHVQFLLLVLAGWVNRQQQDEFEKLETDFRITHDATGRSGCSTNYDALIPVGQLLDVGRRCPADRRDLHQPCGRARARP